MKKNLVYVPESDTVECPVVTKVFDLRPAAIIEWFDLKKPIYKKTSAYGHFNSADFPWEAENAIQDILTAEKRRNIGSTLVEETDQRT